MINARQRSAAGRARREGGKEGRRKGKSGSKQGYARELGMRWEGGGRPEEQVVLTVK